MTRVGLIGPPDREEIARLEFRLEERGSEGIVLSSREDPQIQLSAGEERACGVDLRKLKAFYVSDLGIRPPLVRDAGGEVDEEASRAALAASRRHLASWNALLARLASRCVVVNPPETHDLHGLKPWEMSAYAEAGLPIPRTIATTDPRTLADETADGPWVRKGMVGGYGYTEVFDVPAAGAAPEPVMVQELVEGDNVRAFVVGGEVAGAAAVVARTPGEVDSRRGDVRVERVELPEEAARTAVAVAGLWGMPFAAIDFMRDDASGEYLVLECNSAPFFVEFERATGIDVSSRLADLLLERRRK